MGWLWLEPSISGKGQLDGCGEHGIERSGVWIPAGSRFSAHVHTGPGVHPASNTMGTGAFPGVKRPGHGADHLPQSSTDVKGRVELYLYSPSGPSWPVLEWTLPLGVTCSACTVNLWVLYAYKKDYILYCINWLFFITYTVCAYWAVRADYLNVFQVWF